jgi:hypothetical protein
MLYKSVLNFSQRNQEKKFPIIDSYQQSLLSLPTNISLKKLSGS